MAQSNASERVRGERIRGLSSLPEMLARTVRSQGSKPALGYKRAGGWGEISYERLYERVRSLAAGLAGLGVGNGDAVALMSTSRPEWPIVDLATQSLGAMTVPVYPTLGEGQTAHILADCGAKVAVVENGGLLARVEAVRDGGTAGPLLRLKLAVYDRLVLRKLREAVGGRLKFFVSGGARLNPEIGKLFYAAGVKIVEGYGLTETSPVISCNRLERIRFGTVGPPLDNLEVTTDEHGEVLVRGPSVMRGYLNNEAATAEAFTEDGFYRTGDIGEFDEAGYLKITDRAKNLLVLSTGKNVAPQPVETALVAAPHVTQAVLVGDGRKYVSALIVPDYEAVRRSLDSRATDEELAADERTRGLVQGDIETATAEFAPYERPKRFALLERELSQEAGELTPTLKVKLGTVRERYAGVVERLYE